MSELKKLELLLRKGKITRRDFLTKVSALGLTAALSPALLIKPATAAKPKQGGRFRMGMTGGHTTDSLDPAKLTDFWNYNTNWMFRNCLVEVDYKGDAIPELAESWEASKDAVTWRFKLRKGVEFHNGKYAVIFTLDGGSADFPYILSDYHLTISPDGTSGKEWDKGIGTGGYILKKFEPGVVSSGKRNPNYFKENRAHFDEVEMKVIEDSSARTNALKTGLIDMMSEVDLKTAHLLKRAPNVKVLRTPGMFHNTMPMWTDTAPFDNNDVRLALKYAVNREKMVET
ncbi:MAG: ABC transporter substrate-binding protein, partial [Deltaproteobacteria bacterium]